jgi:hypothetical protein
VQTSTTPLDDIWATGKGLSLRSRRPGQLRAAKVSGPSAHSRACVNRRLADALRSDVWPECWCRCRR